MPPPLRHTVPDPRPQTTVPSPTQSHHPITGSRLRNLFTPHKSATFAVTVTIHSVQNVPQVKGFFSVGWKFRDADGRGRAKVDVKAASIKNEVVPAMPSKPLLPLPRNIVGKRQSLDTILKRRSLDTVDSRASSATSSITTFDDSSNGPNSPSSISTVSTTGIAPLISGASSVSGVPVGGNQVSMDSVGRESTLASVPKSSATSVASSRRTSETSTEVPARPGEVWLNEQSDATLQPSHDQAALSSHLTVPIQHTRATRRQANSMHKVSSSSLRSSANSGDHDHHPPLLVDSISVPANTVSERQGCTPIAQLNNHSCEWGCTVTQLVRIKIHPIPLNLHHARTTRPPLADTPPLGILGAGPRSESGLKLKVWQHIRPPTPDETRTVERGNMKHRANGRTDDSYEFGGMNLDLAEFVGEQVRRGHAGGVTRRYLLTERAKTNATIKLTIDVKQVAGETNYIAPLLQKRHIVAGLADLANEDPIIEPHHHHHGLHLTPSNASSNSDLSSLSTNSRTPSIANLRLSTSSCASSNIVTERIIPSPLTRLKKPPEEHLLKLPKEVTKSSVAAAGKAGVRDTRDTTATEKRGGESVSLTGDEERTRDGYFETHAKPPLKEDDTRSEHRHPRHHYGRFSRAHRHHHPHHVADPEAEPLRLAEAFFNPRPSNVYTPFTYVVDSARDQTKTGTEGFYFGCAAGGTTDDDEASDATPTASPRRDDAEPHPHPREHARWNAVEGAWQRRRGRGYGKMRTMPRRPVREIPNPFFKRLGAQGQAQDRPVVV